MIVLSWGLSHEAGLLNGFYSAKLCKHIGYLRDSSPITDAILNF